ncbi:hypothetical protein [Pedobacter psychroterrae]|uniref:Uncharacterized protein n=1 Tax=Pedobacter psychroterrae TaxID=2530453 RepID=A0A4V2MK49_9SPHI|nr:hypothetical protein [Pedobacter psychroterrae]TCC96826.1 hypothetical protein EZ437_20795 [Pedobacter psychroterrae]
MGLIDFEAFFATQIEEVHNSAIGPYYWFIGDNANYINKTRDPSVINMEILYVGVPQARYKVYPEAGRFFQWPAFLIF